MTPYQIALYPFELHISGHRAPEVEAHLSAVLHAFRVSEPLTPFPNHHESLTLDYPACQLRFTQAGFIPQIEVIVKPQASDLTDVIDEAEPEIVNQAVRASSGLLWLHGACLTRGDERILLIAETGTGKTTLSLGLLAHGFRLITDDIILINLATRQIIPVPRCPKVRPPAPDYLRAIGFDLNQEARMQGRYVLLPPERFAMPPTPAQIDRVYVLHRDGQTPGGAAQLSLTSGILSLLHGSNLLSLDPTLVLAHELFANTTFVDLHLSDFSTDLAYIAQAKT